MGGTNSSPRLAMNLIGSDCAKGAIWGSDPPSVAEEATGLPASMILKVASISENLLGTIAAWLGMTYSLKPNWIQKAGPKQWRAAVFALAS